MYLLKKRHIIARRIWAKLQFKLLNMRFKIVGGKIDEDATLILINHQSLLDIVIYEGLHPKDLAWVAKKEIADIPWFGRILDSSDMIIINRSDRRGLIKLLKDVKDRLDDNRPIAMFPEGTRGRGDKILKFKEGAKIIAEKYNLKVQPIVLCNTRNIVDSQNHLANGGLVTINYLPSFYPKDRGDDWFKILHEDMSKVYSDDLAEYFSNK
jgi:1-acyl-sn-glycerol-3-phosphate acyltransferase